MLLGLDVGTSALKAVLFEHDGTPLAQTSVDYKTRSPQPGWFEQDPRDWYGAACAAIPTVLRKAGASGGDIKAVGVAGQSWATVMLDSEGRVLCDAPLWMDGRAASICDGWAEDEALFETSANPFMPGYATPKLLWLKRHRPDVMRQARVCLSSNGYIVYKLTGASTLDMSQGYGWHCFDMERGCYDASAARRLGVNLELLPGILECHAVAGVVTGAAARETGLPAGIPVAAGGLDAACGTLGVGVVNVGEAQEQGGRAGGMSVVTGFTRDKRLIMSRHVVEGAFLLQGGTVGGGGAFRWLRDVFAPGVPVQQLDKLAAQAPAGAGGLVFLPYLAGERSPIWDARASGLFFGLNYNTERAHIVRAVMEGVAFSLEHNLRAAREAGADPEVLNAMGGAANSAIWTQIKADVTGKRIRVHASDTATALGAALLAGVGAGVYNNFGEAAALTPSARREHTPDMAAHALYRRRMEIYLELYGRLADVMHKQGADI